MYSLYLLGNLKGSWVNGAPPLVPESTPPHVAKYKDRSELLTIKLMEKVYAGEHFHKYELYHKHFFLTVLEDSQKKKKFKKMQSSEDTKFFRLIYNIFQSLQFTSVK